MIKHITTTLPVDQGSLWHNSNRLYVIGSRSIRDDMEDRDVEAVLDHNHGFISSDLVFSDVHFDIGEKRILHGVAGYAESGTMLALMGPSGAGKTTLLNILAGRTDPSSGQVLLNGKPVSKRTKRQISYVLQEDILLTHLTVKEVLTFTAQLRLPESMAMEIKLKKVEEVIDALDMRKCANTVIGDSNVAGISGGEKKRTSIGCELLTNPVLLMLDEPTTGLDSSTAYTLIKILKKHMKDTGKMVVASIHQPSSQTFFLFDRVLLLSDGKVAYFGSSSDILTYFASLGIRNRPNFNPADFMLETVKKESTKAIVMEAARNAAESSRKPNPYKRLSNAPTIMDAGNASVESRLDPPTRNSIGEDTYVSENEAKWPTGFLTQTMVLTRRNFKEAVPKILSRPTAALMIFVSFFYGTLSFQLASTEEALSDRLGSLYFLNVNWAFRCAFETMLSLSADKVILNKERASGYYRLSAFFVAKMASEFPLMLLLPTLSVVITYWMCGLSGYLAFIQCWAFTLLSCFAAQSFGLFIGAAVNDIDVASAAITLVMQSSFLVGGYFVKKLPVWFDWIKYLSHITYAFAGMVQVEFATGNFSCMPKDTTSYCISLYGPNELDTSGVYTNQTEIPTFPGKAVIDEKELVWPTWLYALVLLGMSVLYRLSAYLILRFVRTPKFV